ncbi:hypothetical protein [Sphingomonas sp. LaA6.9]|uniref:hypothetical protein n=1 Tax=Sphingomonas sp. LaA6.9 TaxID=2919914 RepID=UPI001F4FA71E|nr:hypothetical protein [Sphingomonas sp. LaA6.9]MCJ8156414.1 hypothetical protein [Sphingomonas sp. LaA6.9]
MDQGLPLAAPQHRPGLATDALVAMKQALNCLDAIGAHQCGAHLDHAIHLLRQWCAGQDGFELSDIEG